MNELSGSIPQEIGLLRLLYDLDLSFNNLNGSIPSSIGNLSGLSFLDLHYNRLSGFIPLEMNNITHLKELQLVENNFTGQLPQEICLGGVLENFTAFGNHFTGPIPKSLKNCTSLFRVRLERNQLTGDIAESFGVYPTLNYIDLSSNNFYGELSEKWGQCHNLTSLNISNNNISGAIPPQLGKAIQLRQLDLSANHLSGKIPKELVADISYNQLEGPLPNIKAFTPFEAFKNIKGTHNFSSKQCVGTGGYGTVYKAELPTGRVVAVKKLHSSQDGDMADLKAFKSEIHAFNTDKASQHRQALWLQFICRDLIFGVAKALSYMHHDCSPPIVHRDISSNNVLNFWLYCSSFGVVTLEVIMGRHPGELISSLLSSASSSFSSPSTVDHRLLNDVMDQRPSPPVNQVAEEVVAVVKLAFACLRVNPQSRPTMQQVGRALSTQWPPLSKPFSMITLGELLGHDHS
ncbi:MDIS1-interacting receptor like kinase 2 [Vitis vinifera]|uniref:MDIS1-interacting receptor like kinase 2 n=1 Tax=Vitis vinifera TaxID=29760 RepID=A0A438CWX9_VITVI|nr:MDIS1-interacting receptor like kinase 2 [Vitis vinifera]